MTETQTTEATATKKATLPKSIEDIQAITHVPTTEATESFANFVNKYLTNADNFTPLTPEQAWTVIGIHRVWQSSEERKAEIAAQKEAKEAEKAEKARIREEKAAEREAEKARKEAEKERKAAEKAAKAAAEADDDSDLESLEDVVADETVEGEGEISEARPRKRRPRGVSVDA